VSKKSKIRFECVSQSVRQIDRILTVLQNRQNPVMQSGDKMTLSAGLLPDGFKPST
jgi:hypothetical protein